MVGGVHLNDLLRAHSAIGGGLNSPQAGETLCLFCFKKKKKDAAERSWRSLN